MTNEKDLQNFLAIINVRIAVVENILLENKIISKQKLEELFSKELKKFLNRIKEN
jgi:hypothetical protein